MTPIPAPSSPRAAAPLSLLLSSALLISFGAGMLLISAAYLQDLRMLSELPGLVWAFVCGVSTPSSTTLAIFLVLSVTAFIAAGLLWLAHYLRQRSGTSVAYAVTGIVVLVVGSVVLLGRTAASAQQISAATPAPVNGITYLSRPRAVQDFALPASTGMTQHLSDFAGRYTLLFFGYTHCPDVCPLTMYELKRLVEALGEELPIQVLFVSVDGERDTPEALASYLRRFNPAFVGMSGDSITLSQMTPDYALAYRLEAPDANGSYAVEHSTPIYVIDPQTRLTAVIGFGTPVEAMAGGLRQLAAAR